MIQNLLFDLGGVIMDIKKENCVEAFKTLGLPDTNSFFGEYSQKGPFMMIEEGAMTPDEFHESIRRLLPVEVTDRQIDDAFMKFLVGIPAHRLRHLQELRKKYGIYLLSNTNPIMWNGKISEEFKKEGLDINGYFDGMVTSFEAKALKPDRKIFEYAAGHLGIKPEETLFLDDSLANVKAAMECGFNGAHVEPETDFYDILKRLHLA